jgi:hypothetical protein
MKNKIKENWKAYRKIRIFLAIKIKWLRPYLLNKDEQDKLVLIEFRSLALFFGFDINDMSDEEIKEGVIFASKEMSKAGFSASEVVESLRMMFLSLPPTTETQTTK